jgi:hypothetical protein
MRLLPIDASRLTLLASGKTMPKAEYAELSDGSRKRVPGAQACDPTSGLPLWIVDCFLDDDEEEGRAEVVGVTVATRERPQVQKFRPVEFVELVATAYVRDGRTAFSFRATGINQPAARAAA